MAVVTLHHELRLAHAGRRIAGGILHMQLDLPADQSTLGVELLGPELSAVAHLQADLARRSGQRERHADPDRLLATRMAQHGRRGHGGKSRAHRRAACI